MIVVFARLRWRLLRNSLRGGTGRVAGIVVGWIAALAGGALAGSGGIATASLTPADRATVVTLVFAAVGAISLVGPLLYFGVQQSIPPELIAPYPLTVRQRMSGLLVAAAIAPLPIGAFVALIGFGIGLSRSVAGGPVVVVALVSELLLLVALSRVLTTLLARAMSSRRGRDVAVVLASLVGFSGLLGQFIGPQIAKVSAERWRTLAGIARWTPLGALGQSAAQAGRGNFVPAIGFLVVGGAGLVAAVWLWSWGLARLTESQGSPVRSVKRADDDRSPLFGRGRSWLPRNAVGALAAREFAYQIREPRRRVQAASSLLMGIALPFINNVNSGRTASSTVLFAVGASWLIVFGNVNQFGMDGRALWFDLLSGVSPRRILLGRNLAQGVLAFAAVTLASAVLAAVTAGWRYLPAAIVVGCGGALAALGLCNLFSVLLPIPVREGSNPFAGRSGEQGCLAGVLSLVALVCVAIVLIPIVLALTKVRNHPGECFVVGLVSLPYGLAIWLVGTALGAARMSTRQPEILATVDPR